MGSKKLDINIYETVGTKATSSTIRRLQPKYSELYAWFVSNVKEITDSVVNFNIKIIGAYKKAEDEYNELVNKTGEENTVALLKRRYGSTFITARAYAEYMSGEVKKANTDDITYRFDSEDWQKIKRSLRCKCQSLVLAKDRDIIAILIGGIKKSELPKQDKNGSSESSRRVKA